ncbi:MAG: hypothetical protein QXX08_02700 [Candidatus Bathyarchaeia archaeon]
MKEIVYNYEEFKARVDGAKPLHHCAFWRSIDQYGVFYRLTFRIYGVAKSNGHILIFESQKRTSMAEMDQRPSEYEKLVEKFAKPLGSTEGMWTQ